MAASLYRLGAWAHRRRWTVLTAWLAVRCAVVTLAATAGGSYQDDFSLPGARAQESLDIVARRFPASSGTSAQVVFAAPAGGQVAARKAVVEQPLRAAVEAPPVAGVVAPFHAKTVSTDGRVALAYVRYRVNRTHLKSGSLDALEDVFRPAREA